ncbi:MAG: N-acetylmuramoyl-L-alanine amidase [Atopobium sp.]|nr:N-acetylmuramoyl-L-alanine amidase [Atopobium sp.]
MKRSLFNTRGKLLAVLFFIVAALFATTVQNAYATTYTTMDAQGNIIQSESLKDAVALARATGRPIALDPGHSDGLEGRDPGATYFGLKEGDLAWATAMYAKKYLEKWGVQVVVVRGEHEDPSIKTRVQRAVDANACAIISLHYNAGPASATGSEVLVPHKVSYNYDLYFSGQIFASKVNYYLRNKVGIVTRGDGATERGYNDQYGTDYYENGDESDYYGIVRYARQKGILGVIIEHQFISNPAHAAEFKDLGDNSKVDYIGWADAWAIWEMYSSDTWWSMSSVSVAQKDSDITLKPVLTGVVTDATFTYSYVGPDGTKVTVASNTTATSSTFTLPASGRYTLYITARSSDGQEVTRQTNYDAKIKESYGWRRAAEGWMYSDDNGTAYVSRWLKDDDGWHYFDARGIAVSGWFTTPNGKVWYFDAAAPHNAAALGQRTISGKSYYFDEVNGLVKNNWIHWPDDSWSWATEDGSLQAGWKRIPNGKWFYFDSNNNYRATFGLMSDGYQKYYIDVDHGLISGGWISLADGNWAWANSDGSLYVGWKHMPNGKWFYFDENATYPLMKTGIFATSSGSYYVDVNNGMTSNGWVALPNNIWAWAQSSGALASGWFNTPNGKTWYFDPTTTEHGALFGLQSINGSYYYFDQSNGLLRSQNVTLPDGRVAYADANGVLNIKSADNNNGGNGGDNRDANNTPADDSSPIEPTRGNFSDRTSVLGAPLVTKEDLQRDFNKRVGSAYPAVYAEKGAATGTDFVNQLWQAAIDEGVRPELLYAQVMIETGNLRFGGDVLPEQCNFGGMGATGNGERGLSFDTVLKGLRAQALHLRAYAGYEPLTVDPSKAQEVDKRYGAWILAKKANIIRKLAGTWAMDKNYAVKLVRVMNEL